MIFLVFLLVIVFLMTLALAFRYGRRTGYRELAPFVMKEEDFRKNPDTEEYRYRTYPSNPYLQEEIRKYEEDIAKYNTKESNDLTEVKNLVQQDSSV